MIDVFITILGITCSFKNGQKCYQLCFGKLHMWYLERKCNALYKSMIQSIEMNQYYQLNDA